MTGRQFREDAAPRPFEMAVIILAVLIFVFFLPAQGRDFAPRALCFGIGAGSLAIFNEYRRRARVKQTERTTPTHGTGETGDPN